jgi:Flp pilus assembly protein TadB
VSDEDDNRRPGKASRLAGVRRRYLTEGPIADVDREERREISRLIQRGHPIADKRLMPRAIAYANFRARVSLVLGIIFLFLTAVEAVAALFSSFGRLFYAIVFVVFLIVTVLWFRQARNCYKSARTMTAHSKDRTADASA